MSAIRFPRRTLLAAPGATAVGVTLMPRRGRAAEAKMLNFYNWDTYIIGETTRADFKAASGIEVKMDLFAASGVSLASTVPNTRHTGELPQRGERLWVSWHADDTLLLPH